MSILSAQGYIGDTFFVLGAFTVPATKVIGDPAFTLTPPTSGSPDSWTFTSSDPTILSISGTTATPSSVNNGLVTITARQAWAPYLGSNVETATCVVTLPAADPYYSYVSLLIKGDGSVSDAKGNSLSTVLGTPAPSYSSSAYVYGGGSTYFSGGAFRVPYSSSFNLAGTDFTIESWVNFSQVAASMCLISKDTYGSNFDWCIDFPAGGKSILFNSRQGTTNLTVTVPQLSTGTWYHVAIVSISNLITIYLNGVSYGSKSIVTSNADVSYFTIGCVSWNNASQLFKGYVDDLRVTQGVGRYNGNFTPPAACPTY